MVTIKDVAQRANVSISTVSRVLNNSNHPVNPETKQRILEAIEELGFYPNAMARSLHYQTTKTIGIVLQNIANPYYPGVIRGIEDKAHELGYTVILGNVDRSPERTQKYLRVLREKRVDGVIFAGGGIVEEAEQGNFFEQNTMKTVVIGRHRSDLPSVQVDNVGAAREVTDHLVKLGRRHVVTITGPATSTTAQDRLLGYRQGLAMNGIVPRDEWVLTGDFEFESGYRAMATFLERGIDVDALFAQNDSMAIGAIKAIHERGLRVPEDIAVIGFDNIPLTEYITPQLTTVDIPRYQLGSSAMEVLSKLLAGEQVEQVTTLPTKLIIRQSSP